MKKSLFIILLCFAFVPNAGFALTMSAGCSTIDQDVMVDGRCNGVEQSTLNNCADTNMNNGVCLFASNQVIGAYDCRLCNSGSSVVSVTETIDNCTVTYNKCVSRTPSSSCLTPVDCDNGNNCWYFNQDKLYEIELNGCKTTQTYRFGDIWTYTCSACNSGYELVDAQVKIPSANCYNITGGYEYSYKYKTCQCTRTCSGDYVLDKKNCKCVCKDGMYYAPMHVDGGTVVMAHCEKCPGEPNVQDLTPTVGNNVQCGVHSLNGGMNGITDCHYKSHSYSVFGGNKQCTFYKDESGSFEFSNDCYYSK